MDWARGGTIHNAHDYFVWLTDDTGLGNRDK